MIQRLKSNNKLNVCRMDSFLDRIIIRAFFIIFLPYTFYLMLYNGWAAEAAATGGNLFDLMDGSIPDLITRLVTWCDTSIFPLLLLLAFIVFVFGGFTGNEKSVQAAKMGFKVIFIAFAGINTIALIISTVTWLIGKISGNG